MNFPAAFKLFHVYICNCLENAVIVCLSIWGGPESLGIFVTSP
jgi:hypothetical protein